MPPFTIVTPPIAVVMPPVALLPLAVVVLPVALLPLAVIVPPIACYAPLLHGALKVDADVGNLLQGLDVLEALDYHCEGGKLNTFATTLLVWGVVILSKNLSNTLFCTLSIIAGLRNTIAVVVIAAVSL